MNIGRTICPYRIAIRFGNRTRVNVSYKINEQRQKMGITVEPAAIVSPDEKFLTENNIVSTVRYRAHSRRKGDNNRIGTVNVR